MNNIKYKGQTLTFWNLLNTQSIEIPIIQRDYAQGREDKEELRGNFLNALFDSLQTSSPIKLDFIYGSKEIGAFQPLDGQQRLTTLFLLHWYAATISGNLNDHTVSILRKFSYETRASSREFCNSLVTNKTTIETQDTLISERIIDSSWFFLSWKKDPTIDAMLRTINDIHKWFFSVEDLWNKLTSAQSLISFYHVELKDIGLTDDLYIKMNARGKLLSPFENFKASFQKHTNDNLWEQGLDFQNTFACKIDTIWTDLFWSHRRENSIDEAFMRFISTIAMIQQTIEKRYNRISTISRIQRNPNSTKIDNFSTPTFVYLCDCLDIYSKVYKENIDINLDFPFWQHAPGKDIFTEVVFADNYSSLQRNSASYTQKVLFYAQTEYLRRIPEFNKEKFQCWMRVIRNIVCRGDIERNGTRPAIIRSPETFDGMVALINELTEGCGDIYEYLSKKGVLKSAFAKEQIEEEKVKAKLIKFKQEYRTIIFKTEDTNLLQGRIEFAFHCIDYIGNPEKFNENLLNSVQAVIVNNLNGDNNVNADFRRAMLTISVHNSPQKYYEYWWSFSNVTNSNKRCLIDKFRELEYYIYGNYKYREHYRGYLKNLVTQLVVTDLKEIALSFVPPEDMPNWKRRLIKEPSLLDEKCRSNYIAIPENESCCYLLKSIRPRDLDGCEIIV